MDKNDVPLIVVGCLVSGIFIGSAICLFEANLTSTSAAAWFQAIATSGGIFVAGIGIYWQTRRQADLAQRMEIERRKPIAAAVKADLFPLIHAVKRFSGIASVAALEEEPRTEAIIIAALCTPMRFAKLEEFEYRFGELGRVSDALWIMMTELRSVNKFIEESREREGALPFLLNPSPIKLLEASADRCAEIATMCLVDLNREYFEHLTNAGDIAKFAQTSFEDGQAAARFVAGSR